MLIALRMIAILVTGVLSSAPFSAVWAEESADPAALARELASTQVTLEYGLKAAENSTAKPSATIDRIRIPTPFVELCAPSATRTRLSEPVANWSSYLDHIRHCANMRS